MHPTIPATKYSAGYSKQQKRIITSFAPLFSHRVKMRVHLPTANWRLTTLRVRAFYLKISTPSPFAITPIKTASTENVQQRRASACSCWCSCGTWGERRRGMLGIRSRTVCDGRWKAEDGISGGGASPRAIEDHRFARAEGASRRAANVTVTGRASACTAWVCVEMGQD